MSFHTAVISQNPYNTQGKYNGKSMNSGIGVIWFCISDKQFASQINHSESLCPHL